MRASPFLPGMGKAWASRRRGRTCWGMRSASRPSCREAEDSLARHRDAKAPQRLSVGVTPWIAQTLLSSVVPVFRRQMPHVRLELYDGVAAVAYLKLRDGSLDLMIGRIANDAAMHEPAGRAASSATR